MRTDKIIPETLSMKSWQEIVDKHYVSEQQLLRIDETVKFVVGYCISVTENRTANFDGLFAYLDVDKKHLRVFKKDLKKGLGAVLKNPSVAYNSEGHDLVVKWK